MYKILTDFDGANLKILNQTEKGAEIEVELRDTVGDWFYWCFKVVGAAGKTLTFTFPSKYRVGYYGAAVSYDLENWHWQHTTPDFDGDSFTYTFAPDENEVYFAHDMLYRPQRFFEFAKVNNLEIKTLCKSENGRNVPYIDIGNGEEVILLTARHHACESTGSYVLEGVLQSFLKSEALSKYRMICIPMVDFDGVVDGDQGKNRNGHDHNRDYIANEASSYTATAKIREFADKLNIKYAFDFHSPWHLGAEHDTVFLPYKIPEMQKKLNSFSKLFEKEITADALPHLANDDLLPNEKWNKAVTPGFANYMGKSGAELSSTLETPYFIAKGTEFTPERAIETGHCFIKALEKYDKK